MSPERQFDIQVKMCIAMAVLIILMLAFGVYLSYDAGQRVRYVNELYANLSENMSLCYGTSKLPVNFSVK